MDLKTIIQLFNANNLKKLTYYCRTEDISTVWCRLKRYLVRYNKIPNKPIVLFDKFHKNNCGVIYFKSESNPLVSIIIPVYNKWEYTYSCLKSILVNTGSEISYEIIIADDCSNDETININKYVKNVIVNRNKKNVGYLKNVNIGASLARGQYIHLLSNDTNVQKDWLFPLVNILTNNRNIGMLGSKLIYKDGKLQEAGGVIWKDGSGCNYGAFDNPNKYQYNYLKEVDYVSHTSFMIRKLVWNNVGGFDERYSPIHYEDIDLAFAVRKNGHKVVYQPLSVVVNFDVISNQIDKMYKLLNQKKFCDKWESSLAKEHLNSGSNVFFARDRSKDKQCILVIDQYVPQYDKDAGSRTIFQYLKILCEMGYNVKFMGDDFYPYQPYTLELEQIGVEVLYGLQYLKDWKKWFEENGQYLECIFLNRPHIANKYIDKIKKYTYAKIIYNVCDLHFLREEREYNITKNLNVLKSAQQWKNIEFDIMNKSDVVFTLSTDERDIINKLLERPKAVIAPIFIYDDFNDSETDVEIKKSIMFVGGFNHKPNVDGVKWFVEHVWPLIIKKIHNVKFYIAGSNPPPEICALSSDNIVIKGFVSDSELSQLYQTCRICVVPLRFGAGVKGKTVEAMYNKIPIVSTSIGIEGLENIEEYITAYDNHNEFADEVVRLYSNQKLIEKSIRQNFYYVKKRFSANQAKELFKKTFTKRKEVAN